MNSTSSQIVRLRNARDWSQYRLSREAGVAAQTIWEIESGRTNSPRLVTLERIAKALGVSLTELISENGGKEDAEQGAA